MKYIGRTIENKEQLYNLYIETDSDLKYWLFAIDEKKICISVPNEFLKRVVKEIEEIRKEV